MMSLPSGVEGSWGRVRLCGAPEGLLYLARGDYDGTPEIVVITH